MTYIYTHACYRGFFAVYILRAECKIWAFWAMSGCCTKFTSYIMGNIYIDTVHMYNLLD